MRPFGYGPHSSRITFRREYARILTHKIFKGAAYGNYGWLLQVPNGELTSTQLRKLAECIRPYGPDGCADITTRANIQLRGITMEDASNVVNSVQDMGLTSFMTGMDNVRNLTGSPIAGLDPEELLDVRSMLVEMQVSPAGELLS
jgi:ferredoxin-nitrite reductase